jgi:hypothetical protein
VTELAAHADSYAALAIPPHAKREASRNSPVLLPVRKPARAAAQRMRSKMDIINRRIQELTELHEEKEKAK